MSYTRSIFQTAMGRWRSAAGKLTVRLASHRPCVTDLGLVVYPPVGSMATDREMSTPLTLRRVTVCFLRVNGLWLITHQHQIHGNNGLSFHQHQKCSETLKCAKFVFGRGFPGPSCESLWRSHGNTLLGRNLGGLRYLTHSTLSGSS